MDTLLNKLPRSLAPLAAAAALAFTGMASAAPTVGFDRTGSGVYTTFFDLLTDSTDSALATNFNNTGALNAPGTITGLRAQTTVTEFRNGGVAVTPIGINNTDPTLGYEITKVFRLNETVLLDQFNPDGSRTATFGNASQVGTDVDTAHAGEQQLAIYFDRLGDGTQANPNNVSCYGAGSTACGASDGVLIASARVLTSTASFTTQPGGAVGTGSFDIRLVFDYVNTAYLNLTSGTILTERLTGTLNFPPLYTPAVVWDGTSTTQANSVLLKLDSSESFFTNAVPEPGGLALAGLALAALGLTGRRRASR